MPRARTGATHAEEDAFIAKAGGYLCAARILGLAPLTVGSCIFFLWVFFRWKLLMPMGVFTIWGGVICVALGLVCLGLDLRSVPRLPGIGRWARLRRSVLPLVLLLLNFPVAFVYSAAAIAIETRYVVTVVNGAGVRAESVVIHGGGVREEFGTIGPGERRSRSVWFDQDGELEIEGQMGGRPIRAMVDDYVTSNQGGRAEVRVKEDGSVLVTH